MTKNEFQQRAQHFASIKSSLDMMNELLEKKKIENDSTLIRQIENFDKEAAEVEKEYFDALAKVDKARMQRISFYARKLEK